MKFLLLVGALALGGCTFDETLSEINASVPVVRNVTANLSCVYAPEAIDVAGDVEDVFAPDLVQPNNLARAGAQVACSRLTPRPVLK